MKYILVSYNNDPTWIKEYTDDWLIYDRSEAPFDFPNTIQTENMGQVDYDKLGYLIDNYDNLPDVFLWGKTNLWKSISEEEFDLVKDNQVFTPLLTQHHQTYSDGAGEVCYYKEGMYYERNTMMFGLPFKYAETFPEWAKVFNLPELDYIPFPPGGNYILTKETVHKHPRELYVKMRNMLPHAREPVEAQFCERSYYLLWK